MTPMFLSQTAYQERTGGDVLVLPARASGTELALICAKHPV